MFVYKSSCMLVVFQQAQKIHIYQRIAAAVFHSRVLSIEMEHVKVPTLFLIVAISMTVLRAVQSAPLGFGGPGVPGGIGLSTPSMPSQQQQQQTSGQSTDLNVYLDEENAGYFRGEWVTNSTRLYNRSKAQLKRTECTFRIPPEWSVEHFLNSTDTESEGEDEQETAPPSAAPPLFPFLGRRKRFLGGPAGSSLCTTNRTTAVIRDERKDRVNQFPLSSTSTSSDLLLRISGEDVFGDSGYPQSKEVVWQIELPESRRVVVFFQSFDLDRSTECDDYISVHNENGDLLQFCGQEKIEDISISPDYLVGKRITVKFVASASGNGIGFSLLLI